jgi:hypothetical protein
MNIFFKENEVKKSSKDSLFPRSEILEFCMSIENLSLILNENLFKHFLVIF